VEPHTEKVFRAISRAVVPDSAALSPAEWSRAVAAVEGALAPLPAATRRQLRIFLELVEQSARLRYGRPLSALSPAQADRHLESFERSRVPLLRKGFWGVRTLALMGYYARPEGAASVGYRGDPRGWAAREVLG
jgi:hypothetical protein